MIRLGIPSKGRLQEKSIAAFEHIGLTIKKSGNERTYAADITGIDNTEVLLLQAGEIPAQLESGELHLGITGEDLIHERIVDWSRKIRIVRPLGFGHADLVVAVPNCWIDATHMSDLDDIAIELRRKSKRPLRVATKYHHLTQYFFDMHGIANYRIIDSQGATEGTIASHAAEVIVDITSSGDTLRANHLKILSNGLILKSQACLCSSQTADWSEEDKTTLSDMQDRFSAYDLAQNYCLLTAKFARVPSVVLEKYKSSVANHESSTWISVRILKSTITEVMHDLKISGAEHIEVAELSMMYKKPAIPAIDIT